MAALFRFVAGLAATMIWQRAGRRGPVPPVKFPGKRTTHLPIPSPWQLMVASWVAERAWQAYGPEVKGRLSQHPHPVAHKINDLLPGPTATVTTSPQISQTPAQSAPSVSQTAASPAPTTPPTAGATTDTGDTSGPAATSTATPARQYATQRLPQQDEDNLPPGSVAQSLRSH